MVLGAQSRERSHAFSVNECHPNTIGFVVVVLKVAMVEAVLLGRKGESSIQESSFRCSLDRLCGQAGVSNC